MRGRCWLLLLVIGLPGASPLGCAEGDAADPAAIVLDDAAADRIAGWGDDEIRALASQVRRGRGLVVVGRAASALPESEEYSSLLGRGPRATVPAPRDRGDPLPVAVVDQAHPVLECLTHLLLVGTTVTAVGGEGVQALATLVPADGGEAGAEDEPLPVAWEHRVGRGRVAVLSLAMGEGARGGASALLDTLTARARLHVLGRRPEARLPADLPLAVEQLEASPEGVLKGFPPLEGFFAGRQISQVMSFHGAEWLVRPDRDDTEEPERVLDALKIPKGATVVDLGAGNGYFTLRLARRVGPGGKVLAVDIQEEMLGLLRQRARAAGLDNIEPVLATDKNPGLPPKSVDLVLLVDVYHEISQPQAVMQAVRESLYPGSDARPPGRLVLVEYRGEDPSVPIRALHRMTHDQVRGELKALGFRWETTHEFLQHQRVVVFTPTP
jgi:predicted methyltransferase